MNRVILIIIIGLLFFLQGCLYSHERVPDIVKQGGLPNVNYVTDNEINNYIKKEKPKKIDFTEATCALMPSIMSCRFLRKSGIELCESINGFKRGVETYDNYSGSLKEAKRRGLDCGIKGNNKIVIATKPKDTKALISSVELEKEKQKKIVLQRKSEEKERKGKILEQRITELEKKNKKLQQPKKNKQKSSNEIGSGFYVSKFRHIITNQHVVNECKKITVGDSMTSQIPADLIASDKRNDLAILQTVSMEMASADTKSFLEKLAVEIVPVLSGGLMRSEDVSGGEEILVAGYPLGNMISDTIKVTKGIVSATKGMDNDVSQFEIDAVIRKGNSGGPVYDKRGNIVGVAVSRLNVNRTDTINFGIKGSTVKQFLSAHDVPTKWSSRKDNIDTKDIYKIASKQTVMVVCYR